MMEMLNAGLFEAIVVDDWKARMWAQALPKLKVNDTVALREGAPHRLGHPQGQPEARGGAQRFLRQLGEEAGRDRVSPRPAR